MTLKAAGSISRWYNRMSPFSSTMSILGDSVIIANSAKVVGLIGYAYHLEWSCLPDGMKTFV